MTEAKKILQQNWSKKERLAAELAQKAAKSKNKSACSPAGVLCVPDGGGECRRDWLRGAPGTGKLLAEVNAGRADVCRGYPDST